MHDQRVRGRTLFFVHFPSKSLIIIIFPFNHITFSHLCTQWPNNYAHHMSVPYSRGPTAPRHKCSRSRKGGIRQEMIIPVDAIIMTGISRCIKQSNCHHSLSFLRNEKRELVGELEKESQSELTVEYGEGTCLFLGKRQNVVVLWFQSLLPIVKTWGNQTRVPVQWTLRQRVPNVCQLLSHAMMMSSLGLALLVHTVRAEYSGPMRQVGMHHWLCEPLAQNAWRKLRKEEWSDVRHCNNFTNNHHHLPSNYKFPFSSFPPHLLHLETKAQSNTEREREAVVKNSGNICDGRVVEMLTMQPFPSLHFPCLRALVFVLQSCLQLETRKIIQEGGKRKRK